MKNFPELTMVGSLREQVQALIPVHLMLLHHSKKTIFDLLRIPGEMSYADRILESVLVGNGSLNLGSLLIPIEVAETPKDRILYYFRQYPLTPIPHMELEVVCGDGKLVSHIRQLRVKFGWHIASGTTIKQMVDVEADGAHARRLERMRKDEYILLSNEHDRIAAYRWAIGNDIRKADEEASRKLLQYFRANIGHYISCEELRYVVNGQSDWARQVVELRTEYGWPVVTRNTGRPDLPVGLYILEADRPQPEHDRRIPDPVRGEVLRRDSYRCLRCGWHHELWNRSDPRHLELHHRIHHVVGGSNSADNLVTLCNICHDLWHASEGSGTPEVFDNWLHASR